MKQSTRAGIDRRTFAASLGLGLAGQASWAAVDEYPNKAVRWVVGFPAGGGTDVLARTVAAKLGTQLTQTVFVENRPGAGGMLAAEQVAGASADGYTVLTGDIAILVFNRALYAKVRYDPVADFQPVGLMARFPVVIATHPNSGLQSMDQFLAAARAGRATYGSAGVGTPHHMAMELLLSQAGSGAVHVPYKGDAPALQDLAAGMLPVAVLAPSLSLPYVRSQKLCALAVTSEQRLPQLPDVPTLQELGLVRQGIYAWQGMVLPKRAPAAAVERLSRELRVALALPDVKAKLGEMGMEVIASDGPTMLAHVQAEQARWDPVIKARGIKAE